MTMGRAPAGEIKAGFLVEVTLELGLESELGLSHGNMGGAFPHEEQP